MKSAIISNTDNDVRRRKYEDILYIFSTGYLLFSVWSIIKAYGRILTGTNGSGSNASDAAGTSDGLVAGGGATLFMIALATLILGVDILIRLYVSSRVRAECSGSRRPGNLYLAIIFLSIIASLGQIVIMIQSQAAYVSGILDAIRTEEAALPERNRDAGLASLIIEVTYFIMMTEMVWCTIRLRRLRRSELQENGHAA